MIKRLIRGAAIVSGTLLWTSLCLASGRVTYPDGKPVAGAEVHVLLQDVDKLDLVTDAEGRFSLPATDLQDAFVQIKAPDGKEYGSVNLPVEVFGTGDATVVLQPKR